MISQSLFRLTNLLEREDPCNPLSLTAWKDSTPLGVNLEIKNYDKDILYEPNWFYDMLG
jgi:hypothetical protein